MHQELPGPQHPPRHEISPGDFAAIVLVLGLVVFAVLFAPKPANISATRATPAAIVYLGLAAGASDHVAKTTGQKFQPCA